jgi:hypothetical protein
MSAYSMRCTRTLDSNVGYSGPEARSARREDARSSLLRPVKSRLRCVLVGCASAPLFASLSFAVAQQEPAHPVPVVGPTPSGATLAVFDRDGQLCGRVRASGSDTEIDCGRPSGALRDPFLSSIDTGIGGSFSIWGVVAHEVASVEVVFVGGTRTTVATHAGERYQGRFAGTGRFFLASEPSRRRGPSRDLAYLRQLDAQGKLLAVTDLGLARPVGQAVTLARGRLGASRWRLRAASRRILAPLPGDEERFGRSVCIVLRGGQPTIGGGGIGACYDTEFELLDRLTVAQDCGGLGSMVLGLLAPGTNSAVALLGDGRQAHLPRYRLPDRLGGGLAYGAPLGGRMAIRRIDYFRRDGRRKRSVAVGVAPAQLNCAGSAGGGFFEFAPDEESPRPGPHAMPALRVEDRGSLLCVSLAGATRSPENCGRPPLGAHGSHVFSLPLPSATYAAGVVPADAATVELELAAGGRLRLQTTAAGPYTGRWVGAIRFFSTQIAGEHLITGVRLFDAQGRRMGTLAGPDPAPFAEAPVGVLRAPGGAVLGAGVIAGSRQGPRRLCLTFDRRLPRSSDGCGFTSPGALQLTATCRPRSAAIWGTVSSVTRSVEVRTDNEGLTARLVRLPSRLGIDRKAVLAVIPAGAAPRGLSLSRGKRVVRVPIPVPSVRRQCGYTGSITIAAPFTR